MNERKYRKIVDRNGWMRKVHKIYFGKSAPNFVGYCPFFWFTWFCLIITPVWIPLRVIFLVFRTIFRILGMRIQQFTPKPPDKILAKFYRDVIERKEGAGKYSDLSPVSMDQAVDEVGQYYPDRVVLWIVQTPDWEKCAIRAIINVEKEKGREAMAEERSKRRSKLLAKIGNFAGMIIKPVLAVAGVALTLFAFKVLWSALWAIPLAVWIFAGKMLLFGLGLAFVAVVIGEIIMLVHQRVTRCDKKKGFWSALGVALGWMLWPLWLFCEFIAETIATIYTRECPLIEWGDEDGPIERNYEKED